jgi:hypothetical protein
MYEITPLIMGVGERCVDIRQGLFSFQFKISKNCLLLSLLLIISLIIYLFPKLELLESTCTKNTAKQVGLQKAAENAAELICCPF